MFGKLINAELFEQVWQKCDCCTAIKNVYVKAFTVYFHPPESCVILQTTFCYVSFEKSYVLKIGHKIKASHLFQTIQYTYKLAYEFIHNSEDFHTRADSMILKNVSEIP